MVETVPVTGGPSEPTASTSTVVGRTRVGGGGRGGAVGGNRHDATTTTRISRSTLILHVAVFAGFVLIGVVLWWRVWITGHPTTTITCQCGDPSQELWFLAWTPWALVHGHNPFLTNVIFAGRGGANMMVNTSWMLPSIILAPITWLFGPIASFNLAATVAPAISGWCFFLAARKVTTFVPGQILGGLLFGFSPFVLQNDPFGHLDFTLLFFAPLVFILLYDLLISHQHRPERLGILLGALVVAQFFTSTEFLAICGLMAVVAMVIAAVLAPHSAWALRRRVLTAFGVASAIVVVVLAYPVWMLLDGPRHIIGFPWENSPTLGTTPSAIVSAGTGVHSSSLFDRVGGYFGPIGPNAGPLHLPSLDFLGIGLLVFLALSVVTWYRSRLAWTLVVTTIVAWMFSFGTTLGTEASPPSELVHPWWLPWRIFAHIPLVSDILPIRFGALVAFGAAMLLAISLNGWRTMAVAAIERRRSMAPSRRTETAMDRWWKPGIAVLLTIIGVATLLPIALTNSVPFTILPGSLPAWFTSDAPNLPAHTIVLVVPFAGQPSMGWQAQTGLNFALANGFVVVPGRGGHSEFVDPPGGAVNILNQLSSDSQTFAAPPLPSSPEEVASVRSALIRWNVGAVVITQVGREPTYSAGFFTAVFGRAPVYQHGAWVWHGRPSANPVAVGATTLTECVSSAQDGPLAVPECVLRSPALGSGA